MTSNGSAVKRRSAVAEPESTDEDTAAGTAGSHLPLARKSASARQPVLVLFGLQVLSIVPAAAGFLLCWRALLFGIDAHRYSTPLDYAIASIWSIYSGYSSYSLAAGLTRRWLVFYDLAAAMLRLLGLQAIVWPLTHFTVVVVLPDCPVAAWILCALTAALCNNIAIWLTSNIRVHQAIVKKHERLVAPWAATIPYLRESASRASTRKMDWAKVVRRTVIPLLMLSHGTVAALLWQQYAERRAK